MTPTSPDISAFSARILDKLPKPIQYGLNTTFTLAKDPTSEIPPAPHQHPDMLPIIKLGWFPALTFSNAVSVFFMAYACTSARHSIPGSIFFYWGSLLLIFVPTLIRLLSISATRFERISLLCSAGLAFYFVALMMSPVYFSSFDEFLHWRTADDILLTRHLFSDNALLPVSPFYPGLELVTTAVSTMSGLSVFQSGVVVVCSARFVMILALFLFYERVLVSRRAAGLATMLYMTNPHFLFFDSGFSYESLALPLATFILFALSRHEKRTRENQRMAVAAWIVLAALVITHHMTDFVLDGLFILWAVIYSWQRRTLVLSSNLIRTALLALVLSLITVTLIGQPVVQYLTSYFSSALSNLSDIVTGTQNIRPLFVSYGGQPAPLWERLLSAGSVLLILLCLPLGLFCVWQRYRSHALIGMLAVFSLSFPLSQVFRFTQFGTEITDRAAAFSFISLGCILSIFIVQFWPARSLRWKHVVLLTGAVSLVFAGNVIIGAGPPWEVLPGPYLVSAEERSIEPQGIQAALWTRSQLGPNQRVATDRVNRLLMSTYGHQRIVDTLEDQVDVTPVFFSPQFGPEAKGTIQDGQIHYLVVDLRLSQELPYIGFYVEDGEDQAFQRRVPLTPEVLTKFDAVPQINRVFDSGAIVIYDVEGVRNAPEKP
ncbi:MAG: hypothetical protein H0U76_10090 [Ktedonobacteraceae bacterium]|nr:hypothetical protein [Ktedonobacteraceae bacterium]